MGKTAAARCESDRRKIKRGGDFVSKPRTAPVSSGKFNLIFILCHADDDYFMCVLMPVGID
jgi:hypothetical protein